MKIKNASILIGLMATAISTVGVLVLSNTTSNAKEVNAANKFSSAKVKCEIDGWSENSMIRLNDNEWSYYYYLDLPSGSTKNYQFLLNLDGSWYKTDDSNFWFHDSWTGPGELKKDASYNFNVSVNHSSASGRVELYFHLYEEYSQKTQLFVEQHTAYKVTFDSDGGSAVSSKEVGTGTSIPEPTAPTKAGYVFTGWYDGSTKVTFPYTVNANKTLKAHWAVPTVTIGSTVTAQTMSYDSDNNQFYIHPVALAHGDAVSFQLDGADLPYEDGSATNLVNHKVVVDIADGGVYLKNESGTWKAYVPGYSDRQFVINDIHYATQTKGDVNPYEYVLYGVELNAGDTVKAAYQGGDAYSLGIQNEGRSIDFNKDAGDKVTSVNTHGVYDLYLKSNDTFNYDYFYAAYSTNFDNAFNYVNNFVDGFKAICKESEQTSEYVETLRTKWNEMNTTYTSLDQAAKDYILDEDDNFKFVEFYEDYDYICGKYNFTNFLGRTLPQSLSKGVLLGNNESTSVGAIVIISLATITAGLGFAYYKKRKSN